MRDEMPGPKVECRRLWVALESQTFNELAAADVEIAVAMLG